MFCIWGNGGAQISGQVSESCVVLNNELTSLPTEDASEILNRLVSGEVLLENRRVTGKFESLDPSPVGTSGSAHKFTVRNVFF